MYTEEDEILASLSLKLLIIIKTISVQLAFASLGTIKSSMKNQERCSSPKSVFLSNLC